MRLFAALLLIACCTVHADDLPEQERIEGFHTNLIDMMDKTSQLEREAFIQANIEQLFDFERIARVSLGRSWRELEKEAQDEVKDLLRQTVIATYARRFSENRGQTFVVHGSKAVRKGVVVESSVKPRDAESVKLDYFFSDGKVFNVAADGVSDLSLRRADYNSVLKSEGFDALMAHLEQQLRELRE